jgi:transposase
MNNLRELLRLKFAQHLPHRQISQILSISPATISDLTRAAAAQGLTWPLPDDVDDEQLERRIYGAPRCPNRALKQEPNYAYIAKELTRKGVTLHLLWQEYYAATPTEQAYAYSQFCQRVRDHKKRQPLSMRQTHTPGQKIFVDYAGPTIPITDPSTGEIKSAQLFVGVCGYSSYTFADVTWSQRLPDWIRSHTRMLQFFGGVPELIVPDNLKSGVRDACRFDPDANPTYVQWAAHHAVAILPARPYKPKDKAKAEVAVQLVERWIMARLRHQTFFSLSDAKAAVARELTRLNDKKMRVYQQSRRERFEQHERAQLKPLPPHDYVYTEIKTVRVHLDYHVEVDKHYYSVPYALIRQTLHAHCSSERIVLWHKNTVVATHPRSHVLGAHSTAPEHMPDRHRAHAQATPMYLRQRAEKIGLSCTQCLAVLLSSKAHPEQAYRAILGILSLSKTYGDTRLENACARALQLRSVRVKTIKNILRNGLDSEAITDEQQSLPLHDNVRGPHHYH